MPRGLHLDNALQYPGGGGGGSRSTGRSGRQNAATQRNMRREERVTVPGPVKKQQPDGMSHGGGGGGSGMGIIWDGGMRHNRIVPEPAGPTRPQEESSSMTWSSRWRETDGGSTRTAIEKGLWGLLMFFGKSVHSAAPTDKRGPAISQAGQRRRKGRPAAGSPAGKGKYNSSTPSLLGIEGGGGGGGCSSAPGGSRAQWATGGARAE